MTQYDPGGYTGGAYGSELSASMPAGDVNQAGAAADPFAYTNGSLLTPWTKQFSWGGGGTAGQYTPPEFKPFQFDKFNYAQTRINPFEGKAPTAQKYADFQAPTAENFQQDPGYEFRLKEDRRAMQNGAAAKGTLLTGGFQTALQDRAQGLASQEYGNAYNRALQGYMTNRDTAQQHFGNQMQTFGGDLSAYGQNAQTQLGAGSLNLQGNIAQYDRNYSAARQGYQDEQDAANRAASAAASNSSASYNQALQQYKMEHDIFQENQQNQYSRLMGVSQLGMQGAAQSGAYGSSYAGNAGNIYGQSANAQAAGQMGQANAWGQGLAGAGNAAMGAYYANQYGPQQQSRPMSSYW